MGVELVKDKATKEPAPDLTRKLIDVRGAERAADRLGRDFRQRDPRGAAAGDHAKPKRTRAWTSSRRRSPSCKEDAMEPIAEAARSLRARNREVPLRPDPLPSLPGQEREAMEYAAAPVRRVGGGGARAALERPARRRRLRRPDGRHRIRRPLQPAGAGAGLGRRPVAAVQHASRRRAAVAGTGAAVRSAGGGRRGARARRLRCQGTGGDAVHRLAGAEAAGNSARAAT